MADMILASPMGAIAQAVQNVGAMDQLARLRTADKNLIQDRGTDEVLRNRELMQKAIAFAGSVAPEILSAPTLEEKNARYQQFRMMSGLQGFPTGMLPQQYSPEVERRLNIARSMTEKSGDMFAPMAAIDANGRPIFVQGSRSGGLKPIDGYRPYTPTLEEKTNADIRAAAARAGISVDEYLRKQNIKGATDPTIAADTERKVGEVKIEQAPQIKAAETTAKKDAEAGAATADELARAQAALPGLRETVSSLKELSKLATYTTTGKVFDTAAKELGFGSTKGATARAKMISVVDNQVLPLLRDTFGAAFTAAEGERLRDTLLDPDATPDAKEAQLNAFMDQKVRDIETKQRQLGAQQSATTPGNATQGGGLSAEDQAALDWAKANPNDPRAAQIMQLHGGR